MLIRPFISRNLPVLTRNLPIFTRTFFSGWLKAFQTQKLIYPPKPNEFTTNNRIFENWIQHESEIHSYTLFNQPTILNFTFIDEKHNIVTQSLFDILSKQEKFPNGSQQINLVNIMSDTSGGQELVYNYAVGKTPTLILLKKQLVQDRYTPNVDNFSETDLIKWISTIRD